jgi:hypothetical protein
MHSIIFLDISAVAILLVLADLSKRLGEALKTPSYYKLFYGGVVFVVLAAVINSIAFNNYVDVTRQVSVSIVFPMALRFVAGVCAVFASLQYWRWLITELFKK